MHVKQELPLIGGKSDGERIELDPDTPNPPTLEKGGETYKLFGMQGQSKVYFAYALDGVDPDRVLQWLFAWYRRPKEMT
jgi:hypothetical protein